MEPIYSLYLTHPLAERAYSCQWCGHHIHPTVGTLFEKSRTPLQLWFYAIYLFTTTRHGVPAKELQRQLGVTYKCAWRMGHEIREHMANIDGEAQLSGTVEVDETTIGGYRPGKRGRGASGKTILFGMVQRNGDIMTKVVKNVKTKTQLPIILKNVKQGSKVHSDEWHAYRNLKGNGYKHKMVNHGQGEYVKGDCHFRFLRRKILKSFIELLFIPLRVFAVFLYKLFDLPLFSGFFKIHD